VTNQKFIVGCIGKGPSGKPEGLLLLLDRRELFFRERLMEPLNAFSTPLYIE
jgi:hypothetical protein